MKKNEFVILLNFLKSGLSTRQLDKLLGNSNSKGWISWNILKKYKLKNSDKGKLFLYSTLQSRQIINLLVKEEKKGYIDELIKIYYPNNLKKYKDTFVLADSEKSFQNILSGETRNIIRNFFNPEKKLIEKCQIDNCNNKDLDTVHFSKTRPQIFIECARINKKYFKDGLFKFDVSKTMKCFLQSHSKNKRICFLCKKHHNEFHRKEKEGKKQLINFKREIIF